MTSAPVIAVSPDKKTIITVSFDSDGIGHIAVNDSNVADSADVGGFLDPAAAFLTNELAIVIWTNSYCEDANLPQFCPFDPSSEEQPTIAERNLITAQSEIVVTPVVKLSNGVWVAKFNDTVRLSDVDALGAHLPFADRRADGRASLAVPPGQISSSGLVAWVHYDDPNYLVSDATTTRIYERSFPGGPFEPRDVPTIRPKLESTGIHAREVTSTGVLGPRVKISPPGINIEPSIALSPSGGTAYCAWVHDGTPGRKTLIESNRGRSLKYCIYTAATDSWGPPQDAVAVPDDYPGILEPFMALQDDQNGLLAFTALDESAPERDSGLGGGSRFVHVARLEAGIFTEPVRIHGKCQKREYGHWVQAYMDVPDLIDPTGTIHWRKPEWVIIWQGQGPVGLPEGAGDVMVSVLGSKASAWTAPLSLTPEDDIRSNVAGAIVGGKLRTLSLNGGPAALPLGAPRPILPPRSFESIEKSFEPDLAVAHVELSDPFSSPGSFVKVFVDVENVGLAGSALDRASDRSLSNLDLSLIDSSGEGRFVARQTLPEILPGETKTIVLTVEMPHEPARLRVQVPTPIDSDLSNNFAERFLGTPLPGELTCKSALANNEGAGPAVSLSWSNPAIYDEVLVYRDGDLIASLPGKSTQFVDHYAELGLRTYWVRGRIGVSKSARASCEVEHARLETGFSRGDSNGDGELNITDPIFTLNYLFSGGSAPSCEKAADVNDTGALDITDPINALNFLFLGGEPPRAPFPDCGADPTADPLTCAVPAGCP